METNYALIKLKEILNFFNSFLQVIMEEDEDSKSSSEYEHMKRVVQTMKNYQDDMINQHIKKQMTLLSNSPLKRKNLYTEVGLLEYVDNLVNCIDANQKVLNEILNSEELEIEGEEDKNISQTLKIDHMRLNNCLAQIVREWSTEGESDRKCFQLVQEELRSYFPETEDRHHQDVCILVPGCGLARLPYELALDGFKVLANEQDYFQLATASFIMNHCSRVDSYRIYPCLHDLRNRINTKAVTTPIPFPGNNNSISHKRIQMYEIYFSKKIPNDLKKSFLKEIESIPKP